MVSICWFWIMARFGGRWGKFTIGVVERLCGHLSQSLRMVGNKGSSVVEMSLIMPIIFSIVVMVIFLFLDTVRDGLVQQEGYSVIYTYQEGAGLYEQLEEMKNAETRDAGQAVISDGNYRYEKEGHVCITEVDVCSNRLRRWQVYGNIVWE